jgi:transaldolase
VKLFIDSSHASEIRELADRGRVVGVTTRRDLAIERQAGTARLRAICGATTGPVIVDVWAGDQAEMLRSARELSGQGGNVVVRLPMSVDGIEVVRACAAAKVPTSVGLCTSAVQAVMAAKAGAAFVEAPLGPLPGTPVEDRDLVRKMIANLKMYGLATEVVVGPLRNADQIVDAALVGAHIAAASYVVLAGLGARLPVGPGAGSNQASK